MLFLSLPKYQGAFNWTRVIIEHNEDLDWTNSSVFKSIEKMDKIFSLQMGDECFYLNDEEWIWHDKKDPVLTLVPIFCPKKGGGWAIPPNNVVAK